MFLIVTNQAGQEKTKKWLLNKPLHNVILFESFISNSCKKTKVHVECMSLTLLCTVKKNLPNLDENHDYYILHDKK